MGIAVQFVLRTWKYTVHALDAPVSACNYLVTQQPASVVHLLPAAVDYLGKEESNLTVNFSRPGAQIVGQCESMVLALWGSTRPLSVCCCSCGESASADPCICCTLPTTTLICS